MRLKNSRWKQYYNVLNFWLNSCRFDGKGCFYSETDKYQKECDILWSAWHKEGSRGKLPVMPPETVECEKRKYSDLTLGRYQGRASLSVISRHRAGTIPVPLKGRKRVWLDNVNQQQLDSVLKDIDIDIEAFAISGSPSINDFSFLEKYSKLKLVCLWWNNKVERLWDMTKTPEIEFL